MTDKYGSPAEVAKRVREYLRKYGRENTACLLLYEAMNALEAQAADAARRHKTLRKIDIDKLAKDAKGEFDESGGMYFRRKFWGIFCGDFRDAIDSTLSTMEPS